MTAAVITLAVLACAWTLALRRAPLWAWALLFAAATALAAGLPFARPQFGAWPGFLGALTLIFAVLASRDVRRQFILGPARRFAARQGSAVSGAERAALEAGTVGFEREIFNGVPDWQRLRGHGGFALTAEEQAFLDGPTEELCRLVDDWSIRGVERDIPQEVWSFVRRSGFLGMHISKSHGGLGFSAEAQSLIVGKMASRSPDVAVIVMVPNSLGPGELIERYGTDEQKLTILPRLARGDDIPCFALTGPASGSDAAAMLDAGTIVRAVIDGREQLAIRLDFDKRYITLAPVATMVGLAVRLFDPDRLIGEDTDLGITLALLPVPTDGLVIGARHRPSGTAFPNGPVRGTGVVIALDCVIGGRHGIGRGWHMLMECLSAGRAISLPATATAGTKSMLRQSTAYARVRRQFGLPIGRMEGVEDALVRIAEAAYVNEAMRAVTAAMVDQGERPAVLSALVKYQTTERMRIAVNAAMDLHGGKAICDGPSNTLMSAYQMLPIGITVEGANILTRSLIVYAQGALRATAFLPDLYDQPASGDEPRARARFETAFEGYIGSVVAALARAALHNLTFGTVAAAPEDAYTRARWYRQLSRQSANFALLNHALLIGLGSGLKSHQRLTGRMADALAELYAGAAVLTRFERDGKPGADRDMMEFTIRGALWRTQEALAGTIVNYPNAAIRITLGLLVFPFGRPYRPPADELARRAVSALAAPGEARDRLTRGIHIPRHPDDPLARLEAAFALAVEAEPAQRRLDRAIRERRVTRVHGRDWIAEAHAAGLIEAAEADLLHRSAEATRLVIAVDTFGNGHADAAAELLSDVTEPAGGQHHTGPDEGSADRGDVARPAAAAE